MAVMDDTTTITIHSKHFNQFPSPRRCLTPTLSSRRQVDLNMDAFRRYSVHTDKPNLLYLQQLKSRQLNKNSSIQSIAAAPPTPPLEEETVIAVKSSNEASSDINLSTNDNEPSQPDQTNTNLITPLTGMSFESRASDVELAGITRTVAQSIATDYVPSSLKIISQVMPSCGTDMRSVKTYETLCEHLQIVAPAARYISIHHSLALSEGQSIQDLPRSPPVTPNLAGRGGYFDDPSIFTHFAQVPIHHGTLQATSPRSPPQRLIMPPEASLVVLERYIPPTSQAEVSDFFNSDSCRSYAADRMQELSDNNGSLVLIYPTKTGATTFSQKFIGPLLDPILRELVVLRGLATTLAESLGRMSAADVLVEFDEMQKKVERLCSKMNQRHDILNSRSAFILSHSQTCKVSLSNDTWMNWYVDQEFPRLKQDMIEYRINGGRLARSVSGASEMTEAALAREITSSLMKSAKLEPAEAIEVGVFVIKRART